MKVPERPRATCAARMVASAYVFLAFGLLASQSASADPILVAGSTFESPPPFMENSHGFLFPGYHEAMPFTLEVDRAHLLTTLEVATYHYEDLLGTSATFTVRSDAAGAPGPVLATFELTGITTTQQAYSAETVSPVVLLPQVAYWLAGTTDGPQVNWSLSDFAVGPIATKLNDDDWLVQDTNVRAFALIGTELPLPPTAWLLVCIVPLLAKRIRCHAGYDRDEQR